MAASKHTPKWAPDQKVRAIQSFAGPGSMVVRRGEEFRASHPAPTMFPGYFCDASLLPDEEPKAPLIEYATDDPPGSAGSITVVPRSPIEESVFCREDFRGGGITFRGGTPYPRTHPLVLKFADHFDVRTPYDQVLASEK